MTPTTSPLPPIVFVLKLGVGSSHRDLLLMDSSGGGHHFFIPITHH
jgi:hypothetical protein